MKQARFLTVLIVVVSIFAQPAVAATTFFFTVDTSSRCGIDYEGNGTITHMNPTQSKTFTQSPTSLLDLNIMEASDLRMRLGGSASGTLRIGLRGPRGGTTLVSYFIFQSFNPFFDPSFVAVDLNNRVFALNSSTVETLQSHIDVHGADKLFLALDIGGGISFSGGSVDIFSARKEIDVDINPGTDPNTINPRSRGVIPVAILTTPNFDPSTVDITTLQFGPTGNEALPEHAALEDVDGDGDLDLILHFRTQHTAIDCGDSMALLKGTTLTGELIGGRDTVVTVGCR